jgi:hypothetical protein
MKKELLIASALVGSVGLAGIAEAGSMSLSGHQRIGITGSDSDATTSAVKAGDIKTALSGSVSETTDSGIKLSTGFTILNESTGSASNNASGLTLTFTDGSKLDLIKPETLLVHTMWLPLRDLLKVL